MWNNMKRTNLRIIGIQEGEFQANAIEQIFNMIIEEN